MRKVKDVQDSFQVQRQKRITYILNYVEKEKEIELYRLLAIMSVQLGMRKETVNGYLEDLDTVGMIEIDENNVVKFKGKEINNVSKR